MKTKREGYIKIGQRVIGPGCRTYVIADPAANHNQDFDQMAQLLHAAHEAGADAFKTQTYRPEDLTIDCDKPVFQLNNGSLWDGQSLWSLYKKAAMPWDWHEELKKRAVGLGIDYFSTAFSREALEYLLDLGVPAVKVGSFELNDPAFLEAIATAGVPAILSTGLADFDDVDAVAHLMQLYVDAPVPFALLHGVSAYPTEIKDLNLARIPLMAERYKVPVGLSDHSLSLVAPAVAVGMGASIVEKHIRLSGRACIDAGFSLAEYEFKAMVDNVRVAEQAVGLLDPEELTHALPVEREQRKLRRSLFVVKDVEAGELVAPDNVRAIRPSDGLSPRWMPRLLRAEAMFVEPQERGTPLQIDMVRMKEGGM